MEYNYAYSIERDDKGAYLNIDYYEWLKKKKGYGWGNHIKSQSIYAGDWLVNDQWDFIHILSINDWHVKFYIVPDGETRSIPFEKFAKVVGSRGFEVIKNPLQLMESMVSASTLHGPKVPDEWKKRLNLPKEVLEIDDGRNVYVRKTNYHFVHNGNIMLEKINELQEAFTEQLETPYPDRWDYVFSEPRQRKVIKAMKKLIKDFDKIVEKWQSD